MTSNYFFTILLFLTIIQSISGQSSNEDVFSKFSLQKLGNIQPGGLNILHFKINSTKSVSEDRFLLSSLLCLDRDLKSTALNLTNFKSTEFSSKSVDICEHKVFRGFNGNTKSTPVSPWYFQVFRGIFFVLKMCQSEVDCYRKRILLGMDRVIEMKSLKLADGIFLVKDQEEEGSTMPRDSESEPFMIAISRRIVRVLETHALRVRLGVMNENLEQGRIGHHGYKHAFPMMVGSFMLLASFMVPMGFMFLAVVGGKALILSQIAVVMAMGSTLQRFFGLSNQKQGNVGGIVQHEYYVRDDLQPWQRQGSEDKHQQTTYPHRQLPDHHQQISHQHLTQQQLRGLMNYH